MKANVKRQNDQNKRKVHKIPLFMLPLAERNNMISKIVNESFDMLIEANTEEKIISIFDYLMSDEYFERFTPENYNNTTIIKATRDAVNLSIKNIIMRYLEQKIDSVIEQGMACGKSRKQVISEIQNSEAVQEILNANSVNDDVLNIMTRQIKKSLEKHLEIIENEEQEVALLENQKQKEEEQFIDLVSRYTDGFRFLAEDKFMHEANNGSNSEECKFKDVEQYYRFISIKNKIQYEMMYNGKSEERAIKKLLNDTQDNVELTILNKRLDVINKSQDLQL